MPQASVKRLIECKKDQLIDLVLDIEKYPEFVPFCLDSHVYEKNKEGSQTLIIADLTIGYIRILLCRDLSIHVNGRFRSAICRPTGNGILGST